MDYEDVIVLVLEEVLSLAGTVTSGQTHSILAILEKVLPSALQLGKGLLTPLQNIIAALQSNGQVTAEQIAALAVMSAQIDAAMDAAAKADGLSGVDET